MPQWHTFYSNFLLSWKWLMFNPWLFWAIKLKFLTGRACGRGEIIGADVVVGLETDVKVRFCEFCVNFAILNQIIDIFLRTQTLYCNLNLLYVIWINLFMLKCVTENFNNTCNIFCSDRLDCRVLTALQWHYILDILFCTM